MYTRTPEPTHLTLSPSVQPIVNHIWIFLHPPPHTHTQKHTSLLHSQFNPGVWWGPWLGSLRVLMANGADILMSDQSSCLPSQQHISHSYGFSPPAQAEDLDAYLMFIFYRSRLSRPVCNAKSLKRWQSPCETSVCLTESNKFALDLWKVMVFVYWRRRRKFCLWWVVLHLILKLAKGALR